MTAIFTVLLLLNGTWFYNTKLFPYTQCSVQKKVDFIRQNEGSEVVMFNTNNGAGKLVVMDNAQVEVLKSRSTACNSLEDKRDSRTHMVIK